jgi:4-hydroxy-2-oxoheptanedioate aldolase
MHIPVNTFKQALQPPARPQIGLWLGCADPYSRRTLAGTGFDWLLIDGEHAPNRGRPRPDQAGAGRGRADAAGAHGRHGRAGPRMVAATQYPPRGVRGVGRAVARSSRWEPRRLHAHAADAEICLLVQAETVTAMQNLPDICRHCGRRGWRVHSARPTCRPRWAHRSNPAHPEVQAAIDQAALHHQPPVARRPASWQPDEATGPPVPGTWRNSLWRLVCRHLFNHLGWTELIYNHISLRVPGPERHFLINPFGLHYSEVCASTWSRST